VGGAVFHHLATGFPQVDRAIHAGSAWELSVPLVFVVLLVLLRATPTAEGRLHVRLATLLLFSGAGFELVFPKQSAWLPYLGRELLPFATFLTGAVAFAITSIVRLRVAGLATAAFFVAYQLARTPQSTLPTNLDNWADVRFAETALATLTSSYDPIIFSVNGLDTFWSPDYVPGYPQIHPYVEYFSGMKPILCFRSPTDAARDIQYMINHAPARFSPVIVTKDQVTLNEVLSLLVFAGVINGSPSALEKDGRLVTDLTPSVTWLNEETSR
jgi:hypothetical protein